MKKRRRNVRDLPLKVRACGCEESAYWLKKCWRAEKRVQALKVWVKFSLVD